jgi:hypothetical protein
MDYEILMDAEAHLEKNKICIICLESNVDCPLDQPVV